MFTKTMFRAIAKFGVAKFGNHATTLDSKRMFQTVPEKSNFIWNDQIVSISASDTVQIENTPVLAFRNER